MIDLLRAFTAEREVFSLEGGATVSVGDCCRARDRIVSSCPEILGHRVVVVSEGSAGLAIALPGLIDVCSAIFLMPTDYDDADGYGSFGPHFILTLGANGEVVDLHFLGKAQSAAANLSSPEIVLASSGTSGKSKLASYRLQALISSCVRTPGAETEYVWGLTYDIRRFAGLQVYLQAICSGSRLVIPRHDSSVVERINIFEVLKVNCLSATPSFWRQVLMIESSLQLVRITMGGEIANQAILNRVRRKWPFARVSHIYASTELGVGFSVKDCLQGFPVRYLRKGELGETELKIKDGRLWIKSPSSSERLYSGRLVSDEAGFFDSGDRVEEVGDRVQFLGRDSGMINVGGVKILPEQVEAVLEGLDEVDMACVYGKPSGVLGFLVCAEVVVARPHLLAAPSDLKATILAKLRLQLEPPFIPVLIKFVTNLNLNQSNKVDRKRFM